MTTDVRTGEQDQATALPATRRFNYGPELTLLAILLASWALLAVLFPNFATLTNVQNVLFGISTVAIVGVGMTMVIVTGGIDVSVGSGLAVCAVIVGKQLQVGVPAAVALLTGVATGAVLGFVNGLLVSYGKLAPIITTFATLNIFRFVALEIFRNQQLNGVPATLGWFGTNGLTFGIPNAFLVAVALTGVVWWYMRSYSSGRHLYAIGSNRDTAHFAGIRVGRREFTAYIVTGLLVGLASLVAVGSGGVVQPNIGRGFELQVIAAVVIGGTSLHGGRGSALATLLGAVLVGTVRSALVTVGAPGLLSDFFLGLFILAAVGIDLLRQKRKGARP